MSDDTIELTIDTRELDRALQAMPARLAKAIMSGALQAGGDVMLEAVIAHTPERTDEENPESTSLGPGILKADMHTEVQFSQKYGTARVKVGPSRAIGGLVAYRVNNGWNLTKHHRAWGGKWSSEIIRAIPGKHFLEAAFDESAQAAIDTFIDELGNSLGFGEGAGPENNSLDVEFG